MTFRNFFRLATRSEPQPDGRTPFPYQERFANADPLPHLVRAPTGSGKTAAAILGWLWRLVHSGKSTPRRLVYCLPMRVLVEQTKREATAWLKNLEKAGDPKIGQIKVHMLMGGAETEKWYLNPEVPAILIGTQDMLLSRALNRGYAASRFHWPIDFGLLNNDCLWVFDEPQLMGAGVSTSAQLAGLRMALETFGDCLSVWMSATLEPSWLDTVDFRGKFPGTPLELDRADYDPSRGLHTRMTAEKTLRPLGVTLKKEADDKEAKLLASAILEHHVNGTQTLVVANTVRRAVTAYRALEHATKKAGRPKLLLVHSRFRPAEREPLNQALQEKGEGATDRILVATQVVEAGVDISARTLVTELAPWASIVQRIGRCNRTGDDGPGRVLWIDLDEKVALPYTVEHLEFARRHLKRLDAASVSPKSLDKYKRENEKPGEPFLPFEHKHVLRLRDLLDLFDTTPDISGNDIDIQRFVRGDDPETDLQVFWRDIGDAGSAGGQPLADRRELCAVPIGSFREFARRMKGDAYVWDHLDGGWNRLRDHSRDLRPGITVLLPTTAGGYSQMTGWDPASTAIVRALPPAKPAYPEGVDSDFKSAIPSAMTIADHTEHVCDELHDSLSALSADWIDSWRESLERAARWHDLGKALLVCQKAMHNSETPDPARLLAKSGRTGKLDYRKFGRAHFRHELGSALAVLQAHKDWPFIVAYVIAAHHGKVRLAIRALAGENPPDDPKIRFALGIRDGDQFNGVDLGDGHTTSAIGIDMSPMQLGGEGSWSGRALKLLNDTGPFKLAYLEGLLRAADSRASQKEAGGG